MKHHARMRVRIESWTTATFFLIVFCWLGFAAVRSAPIYQGLELRMPVATRLVVAYGAVAFPLLGIMAATTFILSSVLLARWTQWVWIVLFGFLLIWGFRTLLLPKVGGIGPTIKANENTGANSRLALRFARAPRT